MSNLSCPVCGGVTVRLGWNLGIIRYEFFLYVNIVSLYFGIQGVALGLRPRSKKQQEWSLGTFLRRKFQNFDYRIVVSTSLSCFEADAGLFRYVVYEVKTFYRGRLFTLGPKKKTPSIKMSFL